MAAAGWYRMHRGWQDDPLFAGDPYSRRDAFEWLIANAAWEAHSRWFKGRLVEINRGELVTSESDLSAAWKWARQPVRTFLKHLERDKKLTRFSTGEIASGATKLSICNYDIYQAEQPAIQPAQQPTANQGATKEQPTIEEGKELKKEESMPENSGSYAFFGRTIKLASRHLSEWTRLFHSIPDIVAELSTIDEWWQTQPDDKRSNWFLATKGMLNKKHQANVAVERQAQAAPLWDGSA